MRNNYGGYDWSSDYNSWLGSNPFSTPQPSTPEPSPKIPEKKKEFILSQPVKVISTDPLVPTAFNEFMVLMVETDNAHVLFEEAQSNPGVESIVEHEQSIISNIMKRYYIIVNPLYDGIEVYQNLKYNFNRLSKAFNTLTEADAVIAAVKPQSRRPTKKDDLDV